MRLLLVLCLAAALGAQRPHTREEPEAGEVRLPSGKNQRREILKEDFKKSQADAARLVELSQELKDELDKSEYQVVNLKLVQKAEDIEKLARRIKGRMRRY